MGTQELLKEINKLPIPERLVIIQETLKLIKNAPDETLEKAVNEMESEYITNKNLTSFTTLDFEGFYEAK